MADKVGVLFKAYVLDLLQQEHLPVNDSVVNLLAMIAAHESGGFRYVKQIRGPAVGLLQMEPSTYHDVCAYAMQRGFELPDNPLLMVFNTGVAIKAARLFFMRKPEALPPSEDIEALAVYAKRYWNTELGKATVDDYASAYRTYCLS